MRKEKPPRTYLGISTGKNRRRHRQETEGYVVPAYSQRQRPRPVKVIHTMEQGGDEDMMGDSEPIGDGFSLVYEDDPYYAANVFQYSKDGESGTSIRAPDQSDGPTTPSPFENQRRLESNWLDVRPAIARALNHDFDVSCGHDTCISQMWTVTTLGKHGNMKGKPAVPSDLVSAKS